ncbi:MAG: ABC transporter permease [Ruminococcus sp.]|nr:ABC transporter permease [Ruminococcus sp.]
MYLNILKKDLKRKKAMNVIMLVFIILATMFVSSSVNNIVSVTTALDDYLEMADAPDYLAATMNKSHSIDIDGVINEASSVESYKKEKTLWLSSSDFSFEDESASISTGTNMLQSSSGISMNYFLDDGSILETVNKGELYMTSRTADDLGLEIGSRITLEVEDVKREFTFAGGFKDAVFGANQTNVTRFIINSEDFEAYISNSTIDSLYGGELIYINTPDTDKMVSEITELSDSFIFKASKDNFKTYYIFDMIVVGILLVVSLMLIAIAFVVLRFTITFTLSEEFREIGVMKAIGIGNLKIRGLYLVKYTALSVIGSVIGLALSFPFGEMLMSVSSQSIIMGNQNPIAVNMLCAVFVIAVILLFCYGCTGKVKKMTPIDAIRNGQTGERFRKKSIMSLGKSKLGTAPFLAFNDVVSSPKRYGIITVTFFLCLSLLFVLSTSVTTLKSDSLVTTLGLTRFDLIISGQDNLMSFMKDGGRDDIEEFLDDMEETLSENGMPADCAQEMMFTFSVTCGENKTDTVAFQGTGTTMDMYEYTAGSVPQSIGEIAMTRITADKLGADIGDTVTIKTIEGEQEFIITAFFQSMNNMGDGLRFHEDEYFNYIQASGAVNTQITFTDSPDDEEISRRIEKIKELYPEFTDIITCAEFVEDCTAVGSTLDSVKLMVAILTIVLAALITVLMERSFIAKEQGEIALMKAMGMRNGKIYAYHTLRFAVVGVIAIIIGIICALPLTHLCIDPIFRMMGLELAVNYVINPFELYLVFPAIVLAATTASAFLTSLYTRKIKSSDTANIE